MKPGYRTITAFAATTLSTLTFLATSVPNAKADWCRIPSEYMPRSCGFVTKEQCYATASGRAGYCDQNPFPGKTTARHPVAVNSEAELKACDAMKLECVGGGARSAFAFFSKTNVMHWTK
jgi:hypothetical protein